MEHTFRAVGNPIVRHVFTSDPARSCRGDGFTSTRGTMRRPIGYDGYLLTEWLCFSTPDLVHWTARQSAETDRFRVGDGRRLRLESRRAAAADSTGTRPVTHAAIPGKAIGVAVADGPTGPFRDARGSALITNNMTSATGGVHADDKDDIDPTVLIDDDGQAHLFWGNGRCYHARLKPSMVDLDGPIAAVDLPGFAEGADIHKRDGWYYLAYGCQDPEKVAYAMSRNVDGPWEFKGVLNDAVENCETNLAAIVDFQGKSYLIYHNGALPTGAATAARSVSTNFTTTRTGRSAA